MISGSSVPFYIGRKAYLLAPVSIGEWETYELMKPKDQLRYVLYCSMHRACTFVTKRKVWWLVFYHRRYMESMVKIICSISLPPDIKLKNEEKISAKEAASNVETLYRMLSRMNGWTPRQITDMSPLQLYRYMIGGKDGTGTVRMSLAEYRAFQIARA